MEDYDVFNEMKDIKKTIIVVEDNIEFIEELFNNPNIEIMPIRFNYNLSSFSDAYIDKTKSLFIYYFNENNSYQNELLRIKKHFVHYQRKPNLAYIPNSKKYLKLKTMLEEIDIKVISDKIKEV